jgi:uncharacterized protein YdaU (DUF1376 family)
MRIWFPLYCGDFLASNKIAIMTTEEIGAYVLLLCREWADVKCQLPIEEELLKKMARFSGDMTRIRACFIEKDGYLYNERLYSEWKLAKKITRERTISGLKGAHSRWHSKRIANAIAKPIAKHGSSQSQSQSHKEEDICARWRDQAGVFWKAYPKRKGKGNVEKWFKAHQPTDELLAQMLLKIEELKTTPDWKKENGQFIPMPYTWLNGKRWDDEVQIVLQSKPGKIQVAL